MECLDCGYPYCEALYSLDERIPHRGKDGKLSGPIPPRDVMDKYGIDKGFFMEYETHVNESLSDDDGCHCKGCNTERARNKGSGLALDYYRSKKIQPLFIKLVFGKGYIITKEIPFINCPNGHGGIGDIGIVPAEGIWTGEAHLYTSKVFVHFGNVKMIETRSSMNEDNEPWKVLWTRGYPFKYEDFYHAAKILRKVME